MDRPIKLLRGFKKVQLKAGETKVVEFEVAADELAYYEPSSKSWKIEEMNYEIFVGPSSVTSDLLEASFGIVNLDSETKESI